MRCYTLAPIRQSVPKAMPEALQHSVPRRTTYDAPSMNGVYLRLPLPALDARYRKRKLYISLCWCGNCMRDGSAMLEGEPASICAIVHPSGGRGRHDDSVTRALVGIGTTTERTAIRDLLLAVRAPTPCITSVLLCIDRRSMYNTRRAFFFRSSGTIVGIYKPRIPILRLISMNTSTRNTDGRSLLLQ